MIIDRARRRARLAVYLSAAALALSALAAWRIAAHLAIPGARDYGAPIAPGLTADAQGAASVFIRAGDQAFTLKRNPEGWAIAERGDYPVNGARIEAFLARIAGLRKGALKTVDPKKWEELGLGDPFAGGSGALFAVRNAAGTITGEFILGRRGDRIYVRAPDQNAAYAALLANGSAIAADDLKLSRIGDWLDFNVLSLPSARLKEIEIAPADGEAYVIEPKKPDPAAPATHAPPDFVFAKFWARLTPYSAQSLSDIGRALDRFEPTDVIALGKLTARPSARRRNVTSDGLVLDLFPIRESGRYWVRIEAQSIDPQTAEEASRIAARTKGWAFGLRAGDWARLAPRLPELTDVKDAPVDIPRSQYSPAPEGSPAAASSAQTPPADAPAEPAKPSSESPAAADRPAPDAAAHTPTPPS